MRNFTGQDECSYLQRLGIVKKPRPLRWPFVVIPLLILFVGLLWIALEEAHPYTLIDYIRDKNASPISGAYVRAYERFTNNFLAADTTDVNGRYDLVIANSVSLVTICISNYLTAMPGMSKCWDIMALFQGGKAQADTMIVRAVLRIPGGTTFPTSPDSSWVYQKTGGPADSLCIYDKTHALWRCF